jgi:hypothetical protein
MKKKKFMVLIACIVIGFCAVSVSAVNAREKSLELTGRFVTIQNIAFQGSTDQSHGWPVRVSGFDDAIEKAKQWHLNAFHVYVGDDFAAGQMYPMKNVYGYESRDGDRQSVGVIMERTSFHQ